VGQLLRQRYPQEKSLQPVPGFFHDITGIHKGHAPCIAESLNINDSGGAMRTPSAGRASGRFIPIVKCELCGWDIPFSSAVQREVEGISHYFCSTACESEWERLDGTRVPGLGEAEAKGAASE
jgi:hypothetical protein